MIKSCAVFSILNVLFALSQPAEKLIWTQNRGLNLCFSVERKVEAYSIINYIKII